MPAPIWPTPASRWAIPVLMTGRIPASTTFRRSIPVALPRKSRGGRKKEPLSVSVISYICLL